MQNHVAILYRDQILVHGGGDRYGKSVSSRALIFTPIKMAHLRPYFPEMRDIALQDVPALSYHAAFSFEDSVCLVGGFDGKQRTSDVYVLRYDKFVRARNVGCIPITGRSAHLALPLKKSKFVVIGRDTGQRRWTELSEVELREAHGELEALWRRAAVFPISVSNYCACKNDRGNFIIFGGRKTSEIELLDVAKVLISGNEISRNLKGRTGAACGFLKGWFVIIGGLVGTVDSTDSILLVKNLAAPYVFESAMRLPTPVHCAAYIYVQSIVYLIGGCYGETTRGRIARPQSSVIQVDLDLIIGGEMTRLKL